MYEVTDIKPVAEQLKVGDVVAYIDKGCTYVGQLATISPAWESKQFPEYNREACYVVGGTSHPCKLEDLRMVEPDRQALTVMLKKLAVGIGSTVNACGFSAYQLDMELDEFDLFLELSQLNKAVKKSKSEVEGMGTYEPSIFHENWKARPLDEWRHMRRQWMLRLIDDATELLRREK